MNTVMASTLATGLRAVRHSVAKEYARPILNSISFQGTAEGLFLAAADNYNCTEVRVAYGDWSEWGEANMRADDAPVLLAFLRTKHGDIDVVHLEDRFITFSYGSTMLTLNLINGQFPKYRTLFEEHTPMLAVGLNPTFLVRSAAAVVQSGIAPVAAMKISLPAVVSTGTPPTPIMLVAGEDYREVIMPVRMVGAPGLLEQPKAKKPRKKRVLTPEQREARNKAQRDYRARADVKARRSNRHKEGRVARKIVDPAELAAAMKARES